MIEIGGLTQDQVDMMETIWSFENKEQYDTWFYALDNDTQDMARSLITLLIMEIIDDSMNDDHSEAIEILEKLRLK